jgi:hypothetical protein
MVPGDCGVRQEKLVRPSDTEDVAHRFQAEQVRIGPLQRREIKPVVGPVDEVNVLIEGLRQNARRSPSTGTTAMRWFA